MIPSEDPTARTPLAPTSSRVAEHYNWGSGCEGWHLLRNAALSVIQERVPAGGSEVAHWHAHATQFFFILCGSASMELEGGSVALHAGEGLAVPPGVVHRFVNRSSEPVDFLVISSPATTGDRTTLEAPASTMV